LRNNLKTKRKIRKFSKSSAPIKNQNGERPNSKIPILLQYLATVRVCFIASKPKMVMVLMCDENPIYYIPLERAQRGEHNEMKNSRNG
jgi:hypothetical protein